MKKALFLLLLLALVFCSFGCQQDAPPAGGGESEITGSIVYFFDDGENAIKSFFSEDQKNKEITLSGESTYTIKLRPSFRGSKQAVYIGDCAVFDFPDGYCEITYIGYENQHPPLYKLTLKTDVDFDLTITVDDYTQTVKVAVK